MKIAVIEDQDEIRFSVSKILKKEHHSVLELTGSEENIIATLEAFDMDLLILDVMLEANHNGIDILKKLQANSRDISVVIMTAYTTPENLIEASKLGVDDILQKPFQKKELLELLGKYNKKISVNKTLINSIVVSDVEKKFIGSFETMKNVYKSIGSCAVTNMPVLICGETGTGKELVAQLIHTNSSRVKSPFVAINCASVPIDLFESQLFGHEKGSFTSADKQYIGYCEQAAGGTLFLDEIGELDINLQSKLLRFLEEKSFRRVGGVRDIEFLGRIIAATNVDLEAAVANGKFREDLYFRLNMSTIFIPSLRDRKEDIPLLIKHFIALANRDLHTSIINISQEALDFLFSLEFSGNIRELRNVIYNGALLQKQGQINLENIFIKSKKNPKYFGFQYIIEEYFEKYGIENCKNVLEDFEKEFYSILIKKCQNITKASQYLGISRLTLRKFLSKYDIIY